MPGPDEWSDEDYQKAAQLLQSGRGTEAQRSRLVAAIDHYANAKGFSVSLSGDAPARKKSGDPFEAANAELESLRAEAPPEPPPQPSKGETWLRSGLHAFTMGLGDDLAAVEGINALGGDVADAPRVRAEIARDRETAKAANPGSALGAEILGTALSPPAKGLGAVGAAFGRAARMGRGVELGMENALTGAASSAALADEGEAGKSALFGALGGWAGGKLAAFAGEPLARGLMNMSKGRRAMSGGLDANDVGRLLDERGSGAVRQLGDDMDAVGFGVHGAQGTLEQAEQIRNAARAEIQAITAEAGQAVPVDLSEAAHVLQEKGTTLIRTRNHKAVALGQELLKHAEPMLGRWDEVKVPLEKTVDVTSPILDASGKAITRSQTVSDGVQSVPMWMPEAQRSYEEALDLRRVLDDLAFDADGQKDTALAKEIRKAADQVRKAIINAAEQESPELAERVLSANKAYETAERVRRASAYQVGREMAGTNTLAGPLVQMKNIAEQRSNSLLAPTLRAGSQGLAAFSESPMVGPLLGMSMNELREEESY